MEFNSFYVDIPSPDCVTDQDGPFVNIDSFETEQEALDFASKVFGADATGRVRLISGADFSKQDAIEQAAPTMCKALETIADRLSAWKETHEALAMRFPDSDMECTHNKTLAANYGNLLLIAQDAMKAGQ